MKKLILGFLLHYANRDIDWRIKDEFYKIKTKILIKYGYKVGYDIQHIKKICDTCDGSGFFKCNWKHPETCWSCYGTGVYYEFWSKLDKYKLGNWYFHNPVEKSYTSKYIILYQNNPVIEGYIQHVPPKYYIGKECLFWILLIFNFKLFRKFLFYNQFEKKKITPFVMIASLLYRVKNFKFHKKSRKKPYITYTDIYDEELPF
jgi:hypothetical protein